MTRINLVPPAELYDQHLFAEFREIKMVPKSLARSLASARMREVDDPVAWVLARAPKEFVLGTGHVSFFYDKGAYLGARYYALRRELDRRGVKYDRNSALDPGLVMLSDRRLFCDYVPTPEALGLIRERIASRVAMKPDWYRLTKVTT